MAISKRLQDFLEQENISYEHKKHPTAFTASEVAAAQHIPGKQMLKAVLVKAKDKYILCVLPAIHLINFDKLQQLTNNDSLSLASEDEVREIFPDIEPGAEPIFGNLYLLDTYAEQSVKNNDEVVFNAGTHRDTVVIQTEDFVRLANPKFGQFGTHV